MKLNALIILLTPLIFLSCLQAEKIKATTPEELFKTCAKCHGDNGQHPAFGRSDIIAGQDVEDLFESIKFFQDSQFGARGPTLVMAKYVEHLNDDQIRDLATYISELGKGSK
jgi:cytochrome c553